MDVTLGNGLYQDFSPVVSNQVCTNFWPMYPMTDATSPVVLYPTPGVLPKIDLGDTEIGRGVIEFQDVLYTVNGTTLYRIDRIVGMDLSVTFTSTALGTIEGEGRVVMAKNTNAQGAAFDQICIVVPNLNIAYIFDTTNGVQQITDPAFIPNNTDPSVDSGTLVGVIYIQGYFLFVTTRFIFQSNINDGLKYDALDFERAQTDPDRITGIHKFRNEAYIFGTEITEIWYWVPGTTGFAFQRNEGYVLDKGTESQFSFVELEESFLFLGGSSTEEPCVWEVNGGAPIRVSTPAIDNLIQDYTVEDLATVFAMTYTQRGGAFAIFTLPRDTICYEVYATRAAQKPIWHRRSTFDDRQQEDRWHINDIVKVYDLQITSNSYNGVIGDLHMEEVTDGEMPIVREWVSPTLQSPLNYPLYVDAIEVYLETGTAFIDDPEPILTLSLSNDGGTTWGTQRERGMGRRGQRQPHLIWNWCGYFERYMNIRLQYSDAAKIVITRVVVRFANAEMQDEVNQ